MLRAFAVLLRSTVLAIAVLAMLGTRASSTSLCLCGDADCNGSVSALDALAALRSAVGLGSYCAGNCSCDTDSNREMTTSDALEILRRAVGGELAESCGDSDDECFSDLDCEDGYTCAPDPSWSCDGACMPTPTTTTVIIGDECFEDVHCWYDNPGWHCGGSNGTTCVECYADHHCDAGSTCAGYTCVPE
jgi:hypothetical protein